jgi:hypothetical protein
MIKTRRNIMTELLLDYWQFTLVAILIFAGALINVSIGKTESSITFKAQGMPHMKPIGIPTKGKGFWGGVWTWLMVTRTWEIVKDFHFSIDDEDYVIPEGFVFDGASVPKFLRTWLSPMGVLLIGGLVHDYAYKYTVLLKKGKKNTGHVMKQGEADKVFRDINIEVNGFRTINYLAYWALVLGGFVAWKGHRKRGADWKNSL